MRWFAIILAAVAIVCCTANGQATKPSDSAQIAWSDTLTNLTTAINSGDLSQIDAKLQGTAIRSFDTDGSKSLADLGGFASECSMLGTHAYIQLPTSLAQDVAGDFKDADGVDENLRHDMVPDNAALVRANATASQWLMRVLAPRRDQPLGVIVYRSNPSDKVGLNSSPSRPVFIVLKGEAIDGGFRITQIVFGNPLARAR